MLRIVLAHRAARTPCIVATRLADGAQQLLVPPIDPHHKLAAAARTVLDRQRSLSCTLDDAEWFLHLHAPPPLLILVGAVHIAQSLAPMAALTGADVVVCDPRASYATAERFPGTRLRHDWPEQAIAAERPLADSAVIALSHDPKFDDPALRAALASPCGYVGALGSRRSHAARLERLALDGVGAEALARIHGPVGLPIGALGAAEIAVSVLAGWIASRRVPAISPSISPGSA